MEAGAGRNDRDTVLGILSEIHETLAWIAEDPTELFELELYDDEFEALFRYAWEEQDAELGNLMAALEEADPQLLQHLRSVGLAGARGEAKKGILKRLKEKIKGTAKAIKKGWWKRFLKFVKSLLGSLKKAFENHPWLGAIAEGVGEFIDLIDLLAGEEEKKD